MIRYYLNKSLCFFLPSRSTSLYGGRLLEQLHKDKVVDRRVLLADLGATDDLVSFVRTLLADQWRPSYRDHHDTGHPVSAADYVRQRAARELHTLLGDAFRCETREAHPSCVSLVNLGEFKDCGAIVADDDLDGILTSMRAVGLRYEGMEQDAVILDGPAGVNHEKLSSIGQNIRRAWFTCHLTVEHGHNVYEERRRIIRLIERACLGAVSAFNELRARAALFFPAEERARALKIKRDGVFCFAVLPPGMQVDVNTLSRRMEQTNAKIGVFVNHNGVIANSCGLQFRLCVLPSHLKSIDLRFAIRGLPIGPEAGVICNTPFMMVMSPQKFYEIQSAIADLAS